MSKNITQKFTFHKKEGDKFIYKRVKTNIGFGYSTVLEVYKENNNWAFTTTMLDKKLNTVSNTIEKITPELARELIEVNKNLEGENNE